MNSFIAERALIQDSMYEAALFQRKDNRQKEAVRLKFLKEKGMVVEDHPDFDALRARVAGLKDTDLYKGSKVRALLIEVLETTN